MTSPAELFTSFQDLVKDDASLHASNAETFAKLIALAEDTSVPLLLRVKVVQYIGQYVGFYDAAICKKTAQLSVKLLSASDSDAVDPLLVGAVKLWVALAKVSSERKPEYFAREGTDVLIQVVLGVEGFSLAVREAAKGAIDALCRVNLKPVITKLVHLISDDRESDEPEQLAKEREFSLSTLQSLVQNRAEFGTLWNDEVQQHFLTCLGLVLHTVPRREFKRLIDVAQQLPLVKEKQLLPLLDGFLVGAKLDTDRSVEGLSIILAHVPRTVASYPALAEKLLSTPAFLARLQAAASAEGSVTQPSWLDVLVAASRWATTESAEALLAAVVSSLLPRVFDPSQGICDNLVMVEGTVLTLCYLATKCAQKVLVILSEPAFQESIGKVVQLLEELEKEYRFTAKKKVDAGEAKEEDARALTVLANLLYLLKPLGQRHLPSLAAYVPSWQKVRSDLLPRVKRAATRTEGDDERKAKKGPVANNANNNNKAANNKQPATQNAGAKKAAAQPPSRSNAKKR